VPDIVQGLKTFVHLRTYMVYSNQHIVPFYWRLCGGPSNLSYGLGSLPLALWIVRTFPLSNRVCAPLNTSPRCFWSLALNCCRQTDHLSMCDKDIHGILSSLPPWNIEGCITATLLHHIAHKHSIDCCECSLMHIFQYDGICLYCVW